jgi:hypothetical protein
MPTTNSIATSFSVSTMSCTTSPSAAGMGKDTRGGTQCVEYSKPVPGAGVSRSPLS